GESRLRVRDRLREVQRHQGRRRDRGVRDGARRGDRVIESLSTTESSAMVVGLLTVELHVAGSQSLKDKRMVLRRVKDRLKKFNVAVSEVDHQDLWQRASLA